MRRELVPGLARLLIGLLGQLLELPGQISALRLVAAG